MRIAGAAELAPRLRVLLADAGGSGELARGLAESKRGATEVACRAAIEILEANWPRQRRPLFQYLLLKPLSLLWAWGARRKQNVVPERLDAPVLCVGGLAMGGSGKTPTVLHLAEYFRRIGRTPGILTRGYRRVSPTPYALIAAGDPAPR